MRKSTANDYCKLIEQAIDLMIERLDEAVSFEQIAQELGVSQFHFGRIFSGAVGEAPLTFVRRLRIERAAYQLVNSQASVTEIAFDARYETLEAFIRAFRNEYRQSPTDFRRQPSRIELQCPSQVHWSPDGCSAPSLFNLQGNTMEATIKTIEPMKVLALRHIGPYHEIGPKFGELMQWAGPNQVPILSAVAIYHDDLSVVPPHELRSDAGVVVPADYELPAGAPEGLSFTSIPGGDYAIATHMGPYSGLGDAWARFLGQAAPALGRPLSYFTFEVYVNDCSQVAPEDIQTDLYCSVK